MKTKNQALDEIHEALDLLKSLTSAGDEWIIESFIPEALVAKAIPEGFEANLGYMIWSLEEMREHELAIMFQRALDLRL